MPVGDSRPPTQAAVHWTVRNNYRLRVVSFLNMFGSVAFHISDTAPSLAVWCVLALHLLVYPHMAYWWAKRSSNTQEAEVRNLVIDSFLFGLLVAALQFPLWITVTVFIASTLNIIISRGVWGLKRSQVAFFAGVLVSATAFGWHFSPDTQWPATLLCILGNAIYMTAIGITAYRRNEQLRETREALRLKTVELESALVRLQQSQKDLLEAEKLASLGSLVAGVAHELNTPIGNALVTATAMEADSKALAEQLTAGNMKRSALESFLNRASEMTELIVRSCHKAARLISSFKKVAVDQTSEQRRQFVLRDLLDENLAALVPSLRNQHMNIRNLVPETLVCDSYPGALGQVFSGVVHNAAVHAFADGASGTLTIEAHVEADRVILVMRDDGRGMTPDVLSRVFDPFFTTRLGQGGNGLGLTICRNIVSGVLGGSMRVVSRERLGTSFFVEFPRQAPEIAAQASDESLRLRVSGASLASDGGEPTGHHHVVSSASTRGNHSAA